MMDAKTTLRLLLPILLPSVTWAGGPIALATSGTPLKFDNSAPIPYYLDPGGLGVRTNATARGLVGQAFAKWTALPTVNVSSQDAGDLSTDVTSANYATFSGGADGKTAIIFDAEGSITDIEFGQNARTVILGFAAPHIFDTASGTISEGLSVMNASLLDTVSDTQVLTVFVHEFGHMLGLTHSQLNQEFFNDGSGSNDTLIPVMYPILRNTDDPQAVPDPTPDDELSMAFLYRKADFLTAGGNVRGKVKSASGADFRGANVVIRRVSSAPASRFFEALGTPGLDSWSWPSGVSTKTGGDFEFHLLPAGDYRLFIEPIMPTFTGGSRVGSFDPPPTGVTSEFYNSTDESSDPFVDDPSLASNLTLTPGASLDNVNVILQASQPIVSPNSSLSGTVNTTGGSLPPAQIRLDVPAVATKVTINLSTTGDANIDLFVRQGAQVSALSALGLAPLAVTSDFSSSSSGGSETITITSGSNPPLRPGTPYFIALVNQTTAPVAFALQVQTTTSGGTGGALFSRSGNLFSGGCETGSGTTGTLPVGIDLGLLLIPLALLVLRRTRGSRAHRVLVPIRDRAPGRHPRPD